MVISSLVDVPLSVAAVISGAAGVNGAVMLTMIFSAGLASDTLPARLVAVAVMACGPSLSAGLVVMVYVLLVQTCWPTRSPSAYSLIVSPVVHAPVKSGVASLVVLSVLDAPLSVAAVMSGASNVAGVELSMVTLVAAVAVEALPAGSVWRAVIARKPFASGAVGVHVQVPLATTNGLPSTQSIATPSTLTVTAAPFSPVPVIAGVLSLVIVPVVGAVITGTAGGVLSYVTLLSVLVLAALLLPAVSVTLLAVKANVATSPLVMPVMVASHVVGVSCVSVVTVPVVPPTVRSPEINDAALTDLENTIVKLALLTLVGSAWLDF